MIVDKFEYGLVTESFLTCLLAEGNGSDVHMASCGLSSASLHKVPKAISYPMCILNLPLLHSQSTLNVPSVYHQCTLHGSSMYSQYNFNVSTVSTYMETILSAL